MAELIILAEMAGVMHEADYFSHVQDLLSVLCPENADLLTDYTVMMVKFSQYFAVSIYFVIYETLYILKAGFYVSKYV